jgi:Phage Tail Collar Domain.
LANVAHSTLTGSALHEPKGVSAATSGQVYIADGAGSGAWSSASTALTLTGQISDFWTLAPPSGWLECDGSSVSRTTYAALFAAVTIQQSGTRTNGSAIITGLSSTTNMRAGYYIGGTGITNGTTILTVDSATQVTMSANATSSGTSTCIISAGALGDGSTTFTLPDTTTSGRYRRSRYSTNVIGLTQAASFLDHTHSVSGTSGTGTSHNHSFTGDQQTVSLNQTVTRPVAGSDMQVGSGVFSTTTATPTVTFTPTGTNAAESSHTHSFSATSGSPSAGSGTETRPVTMVVLTCIRT